MHWRARVVAPLVAAVLGIGGGSITALVVTGDDDGGRPSSVNDPLHLGVPLVDLDCTGEAILVVAYGNSVAPLGTAVEDNGTSVRYLRTDESCTTVMGPEGGEPATYVAYLGPYDTPAEPCGRRMTPEHRGDLVTVLKSGNTMLVRCPCNLSTDNAPELRVGVAADAEAVVWIRSLQAMLHDYDAEAFPLSRISGSYDAFTAGRVTDLQEASSGLYEPGVVDAATWKLLTDTICRIYDY